MNCGHDESPRFTECDECDAWYAAESAYWSAYFGRRQIREAAERDREERDTHGRLLTEGERLGEARRLK